MWNDDRKRPGKRYSYKMRTKWVNIGMICVYAVVQCILITFTIFIAVQRFVNGSVWHKMQYLRRFEHRTSRSTFIAKKTPGIINTYDEKSVIKTNLFRVSHWRQFLVLSTIFHFYHWIRAFGNAILRPLKEKMMLFYGLSLPVLFDSLRIRPETVSVCTIKGHS